MNKTLTITEAQDRLQDIPDELSRRKKSAAMKVTRKGKPVLAIMQWDQYEGLLETIEIMRDREFLASVRKGIRQDKEGKGIPWEKALKKLAL